MAAWRLDFINQELTICILDLSPTGERSEICYGVARLELAGIHMSLNRLSLTLVMERLMETPAPKCLASWCSDFLQLVSGQPEATSISPDRDRLDARFQKRSRASRHRGRLWAENNSDQGATLCLTVRAARSIDRLPPSPKYKRTVKLALPMDSAL